MQILLLAISLIFGIVFTVIGLFIGHIILFDSILLAILSGVLCKTLLSIHPAFSLLIGIVTFLLLFWLQNTKVGFWLIGGIMSLLWASVFGLFAYLLSNSDPIWGWVVFGLALAIVGVLHINARNQDY